MGTNINKSEIPATFQSNKGKANRYTITQEILKQKLNVQEKGRFRTQFCVIIIASVAALSFGMVLGWSTPATHLFNPNDKVYNYSTRKSHTWIAHSMPIGCSCGIIPWRLAIIKIGPKKVMIIQSVYPVIMLLRNLSVCCMTLYNTSKFFLGFFFIPYLMGGERLLIDVVHCKFLNKVMVMFRSSILLGVLLSYIIGYFSNVWLSIVIIVLPIINTAILLNLPESPVFLYKRNEKKAAESSLRWYRGNKDIITALQTIQKDSELYRIQSTSLYYILHSKVVLKGILIVLGLNFFRVFSGYYILVLYNHLIWQEFVQLFFWKQIIILAICLYITDIVASTINFNQIFGVRVPLLIGTSVTAIVLMLLSLLVFLQTQIHFQVIYEQYSWLLTVQISILIVAYEIGLGTCSDVILVDYLPCQVYAISKMIVQSMYWLNVFLLVIYLTIFKIYMPPYLIFMSMSLVAFMGVIFCYNFAIECKGKSLLQIQLELGGNPIGNRGTSLHRCAAKQRIYIP